MRKSYTSVRAMAVARSLRCRVRRLFSSECIQDLSVSCGREGKGWLGGARGGESGR